MSRKKVVSAAGPATKPFTTALSRDVEKSGGEKRPFLSNLRESSSLEQDTDCIVFRCLGEYYDISEYENGTPTTSTLLFDMAKYRSGAIDESIAAYSMRRGTYQALLPLGAGHGTLPAFHFSNLTS